MTDSYQPNDTYGHTPIDKAFGGDVYGIGYDAARAARQPIKLGIIGAGGVAQSKYFPAVARLRMVWEPIEIVALAEPRAEAADKVRAIYGGRAYADVSAMLQNESLDGVIILTSDDSHAPLTHQCLDAGLPVLVEKPIARSLTDAASMCQKADARGLALMCVANKRYSPPYRRAKSLVDAGKLGELALFSGKFNLGYDYVDLLESGTIHLFDLALYLMGAVKRVHAVGVNRHQHNKGSYPFDNLALTLEFVSGAVGSLTSSASALSLKPWERVEVYGDHKWLCVDDQYELTFYESEMGGAQSWRPVVPNTLLCDEEFGGYTGILENFAQVIRGNEQPRVTGWDGYHAYELLTATHLSLARRQAVELPLTNTRSADDEVRAWLGR